MNNILNSLFVMITLCISNFGYATTVTFNALRYNDETEIITNVNTGVTYIGLGAEGLSMMTRAGLDMQTSPRGLYDGYHIATQADAFAFYQGLTATNDVLNSFVVFNHLVPGLRQDSFGDNQTPFRSSAFFDFGTDEKAAGILWVEAGEVSFVGRAFSVDLTDSLTSIPYLLVSDTASPVSAVPVPAAIWLMGSGLLGLLGVGRKNKIQAQSVTA